jgi:hypothetical protein
VLKKSLKTLSLLVSHLKKLPSVLNNLLNRKLNMTHEQKPVLEKLTLEQVQQALEWLNNPSVLKEPQNFPELNSEEWYQLDLLLKGLQWEKENNRVH